MMPETNCPICSAGNIQTTYIGKIRNGAPGRMTIVDVSVFRCGHCHAMWHEEIAPGGFLYQTDNYRESMGETVSLSAFYARHDAEVLDKLNYSGTTVYRNKLFMDVGCGGAGYADFIRNVVHHVILVEPNESFAAQLRVRGYEVFSYPEDALEKYCGKIELLTSYDVVEHVENPRSFLQTIHELLAPDGQAFIGTPTDYPVLRGLLGAEFDSFVFSVQHPWVFSRKSLEIMAEKCGFRHFEVKFHQRFGLGNLLAWLQHRKPCGEARYDFIYASLDALYKSEMAKEETAEYLVLELQK